MRRKLMLTLLLLPALARAADPLPSMDDLQKLYDDKNYSALLLGTTRVLQLRGAAAASYHRPTVWMLKAESLLQSSQFTPAAQAAASAADEKDATDDERDLGIASAMLFKRSDRKGYQAAATHEHPAPQLFNILDKTNRPAAMQTLLDVELADVTPRVDKLKDSQAAGPIIALVKRLVELRPLERVAEKSADKIDALEKSLGQNFAALMGTWSDASGKRLETLSTTSQQTVVERYTDAKGVLRTRTGIRGLLPQEQQEIRALAKDAKSRAEAEQQIAAAMSTIGKAAIGPSQAPIQAVYDQTQTVLRAAVQPR